MIVAQHGTYTVLVIQQATVQSSPEAAEAYAENTPTEEKKD
jgi:hypothetical protein